MKRKSVLLSASILLTTLFTLTGNPSQAKATRDMYQIRIYQLKDQAQEQRMDRYLQEALVPALNRAGIARVGVFKPIANDTASVRRIYVLIPFAGLDQWQQLGERLEKDPAYQASGKDYVDAAYDNPPYLRMESILLEAFDKMPQFGIPDLKGPLAERIYELRSYEGPTEKIHQNKVRMFNVGDEVSLFKRLGFNAVFYAEVLSGCHMPNLMYMTSFENMEAHDQHWKNFSNDPVWKTLSADPQYQHNVSHIDIVLMHPTAYSQL
jgi:hypothetical protein